MEKLSEKALVLMEQSDDQFVKKLAELYRLGGEADKQSIIETWVVICADFEEASKGMWPEGGEDDL